MSFRQRSGPPSWFVIVVGVAIVFGIYYVWLGFRNFVNTGVSVSESTEQAVQQVTATALQIREIEFNAPSPLPSLTPVPACQEFVVRVPEAIVRATPDINSGIVGALKEGEIVCVIALVPNTNWYLIDQNTLTRRLEMVYMHRDIIRALHPTATPTNTLSPTPTDTATMTQKPSPQPTEPPITATRQRTLPSPTPLPSATAAPASVSL